MMTIAEIATLAQTIATEKAFAVPYNRAEAGTYLYSVEVSESDGRLHLTARVKAKVSEKRASAELAAVWTELMNRLDPETKAAYRTLSHRGYKVWRTGFTNMNRFCTDGFRRGLEKRAESAEATAAE